MRITPKKNTPRLRAVSGVQPTGKLHIGNYLGAVQNFVFMQDRYDLVIFLADLHSLTEQFTPEEKTNHILDLLATYLACGIDPKKTILFQQSHIPAHAQLAWILSTLTPIGELERMTQFKDKAARQVKNINVGLFTYPVLMAADILLYNPDVVPVGEDQVQHLELTRTLARHFNTRFGSVFTEPKALLTKASRVMSLQHPEKKMSKSLPPADSLFLDDTQDEIRKKIQRAVTDSGTTSSANKKTTIGPGVKNLLHLLEHFGDEEMRATMEAQAADGVLKYSELKTNVSTLIADHFAPYRHRKREYLARPDDLRDILHDGKKRANALAEPMMARIEDAIGLVI